MADEVRLAGSFGLSFLAALVLVPVAIRLAIRTDFVDNPGGYKAHEQPTPYLGGLAVVVAVSAGALAFGSDLLRFLPLLIWAGVLFVVGTIDDRRNLGPFTRLGIEIVAASALWHYGLGWGSFDSGLVNLALTVFWVVGLVNAFNLMDNMDGAASTVAGVSAAGAAIAAIVGGDIALAIVVIAVAGACCGFLRYNLAKPARIFLGDGGSMPLGFIVAGAVMAQPTSGGLGWTSILAAAPFVGLPILDTTLVVMSRRRAHRPILLGGRDHLTHRLRTMLGSARAVAVFLGVSQAVLCLAAIALSHLDRLIIALTAIGYLLLGAYVIYVLETPGRGRLTAAMDAAAANSSVPSEQTTA